MTNQHNSGESTISELIRSQRQARNLSVRAVASLVGLSANYLSDLERGLRTPSAETVAKLAQALGADVDEWLRIDRERRIASLQSQIDSLRREKP